MEARAEIRQFGRLNDLARGGTITHSVAFRNIPGPTVPLTPQENAPDGVVEGAFLRAGLWLQSRAPSIIILEKTNLRQS